MPLAWRLQVLEAKISERLGRTVCFAEMDLYGLQGPERESALDALIAGAELPLFLSNGALVYSGDTEVENLTDALRGLVP